jgi:hypothetical protein
MRLAVFVVVLTSCAQESSDLQNSALDAAIRDVLACRYRWDDSVPSIRKLAPGTKITLTVLEAPVETAVFAASVGLNVRFPIVDGRLQRPVVGTWRADMDNQGLLRAYLTSDLDAAADSECVLLELPSSQPQLRSRVPFRRVCRVNPRASPGSVRLSEYSYALPDFTSIKPVSREQPQKHPGLRQVITRTVSEHIQPISYPCVPK